jgi:hypothetical protein
MTTLTPASRPITPGADLVAIAPDSTRRGRINAAAFGAIVYFGLSFAQALVVPGSVLVLGQLAALVVGMLAAGRLAGANDRRTWLRAVWSVVVAIAVIGVAMWGLVALLIWGPLAP